MLVEVLVGAAVSLLLLVVIIGYAIRRSPQLFVAERLAEKVYEDDE
ncbi:hypothetical protein OB920_20720 [Halobacteria archaeon HArc-gm2]|nr:hypothetical protein [Halobacteria archaeon HArc-gm2]